MNRIILTLLVIATLFSVPASADLFSELDLVVDEYNMNADSAPAPLKTLFGNENILAAIDMGDGSTLALKIVTEDMFVTEFSVADPDGSDFNPSLMIYTDEGTVSQLLDSEDPLSVFLDAYDTGAIDVEAAGFVDKVTLSVGNIMIKLSQILGFI
ncbi:hypothetical protein [Methanococcoides methylutens]|uniref:SCP2 domain-containing protein n=1 Tax=Methanococcoides methylutens MM1 TaxID=1434104 RepID=A0A0E3WZ93_METMT|nr:hypothetical protein [Methanococcoides methylutens]AKB84619.1 hypothetical protein MCMEM_0566 [Methanococcoides methylutens MM1]